MRLLLSRTLVVLAALAVATTSRAQNGDHKGHVMAPPPAHWKIPDAPVLDPEAALESFALEEGFVAELVASEPMVHDPVALAFDGNGRIWVAEMRGYMPDIEGKKEGETYGRISVLEDTDGDGRADRHTVFLEDYLLPRAVALVDADRTLLFADNEKLYEAEILVDGSGRISAGEVSVVDEDYAKGGNPEHKPNGLLYGIDNWLYNSKCDQRYRKFGGKWIKEKTEGRGQWGIAQDDHGRLFTNTNSNLVSAEEIPPGLTVRNPAYSFRSGVQTRISDQRVWPSRITPGVNRGYMQGVLDEEGHLAKPTAVSGLAFYRGDQFPEDYRGNLFIPEPAGNLVKRALVTEKEDGFRDIRSATEGTEFFTSTDERSRIVDAFTAPDGTLYLLDFYRGIIQHQVYMTSFLRAQVEERKLHEPVGLGRIWRIRHSGGKQPAKAPRMQSESSAELVAHLEHENGWWRDTAQRLLVERGDLDVVPALAAMAEKSAMPLARIHAIWTLEGLGALDAKVVERALDGGIPRVAAEAIRAAESLVDSDEAGAVFALLEARAGTGDVLVRRQLAATLGLFGERAIPTLARLVVAAEGDRLTGDLAASGVGGNELALFRSLPEGHDLRVPLADALVKRNDGEDLRELAGLLEDPSEMKAFAKCVVTLRRGREAGDLVTRLVSPETPAGIRRAIAEGMVSGGKDKKFKPIPVKELASLDGAKSLDGLDEKMAGSLRGLFAIGSGKEESFLVTAEHKRQFEEGRTHYQRICLACHQEHGNGQQFLAPPLVGSEWVLGSTERLIALAMDGIEGPIEVLGKTYTVPEVQPLMPGLRLNPEVNDEQLAAILTYVRNAWGNAATPVEAETVARYREANEARPPWPAHELAKRK